MNFIKPEYISIKYEIVSVIKKIIPYKDKDERSLKERIKALWYVIILRHSGIYY